MGGLRKSEQRSAVSDQLFGTRALGGFESVGVQRSEKKLSEKKLSAFSDQRSAHSVAAAFVKIQLAKGFSRLKSFPSAVSK